MKINWKEPQQFGSCIILFAIFQTIMMQLGITVKCFADGGLHKPLVQIEALVEGVLAEL